MKKVLEFCSTNFKKYQKQSAVGVLLAVILVAYNNCGVDINESVDTFSKSHSSSTLFPVPSYDSSCYPRSVRAGISVRIKCNVSGIAVDMGSQVSLGGQLCSDVVHEGTSTFYCDTPRLSQTGLYDIVITNTEGEAKRLTNGFGVHNCNTTDVNTSTGSVYYGERVGIIRFCGIQPYYYEIISGNGNIDAINGQFLAPMFDSITSIRQTDSVGKTVTFTLNTVSTPILVQPSMLALYPGQTKQLTVSGGVPPYQFSTNSNQVTITEDGVLEVSPDTSSGEYSYTVTGSDPNRSEVNNVVTVHDISVNIDFPTITKNNKAQISVSGGTPPYQFKIVAGDGSISPDGIFTPVSIGVTTIRVNDSVGASQNREVIVNDVLSVPTSISVLRGDSIVVSPNGGVPPYKFLVPEGSIGVVDSRGSYSSAIAGNSSIVIMDSVGSREEVSITIQSNMIVHYTPIMHVSSSGSFTTIGGVPPYSYRIVSGSGKIYSTYGSTGSDGTIYWKYGYTTADIPEEVVIRVEDSLGYEKVISILSIANTIGVDGWDGLCRDTRCDLRVHGGYPPYTFFIRKCEIEPGYYRSCPFSISPDDNTVSYDYNENRFLNMSAEVEIRDSMGFTRTFYLNHPKQLTFLEIGIEFEKRTSY